MSSMMVSGNYRNRRINSILKFEIFFVKDIHKRDYICNGCMTIRHTKPDDKIAECKENENH